MTELTTDNVYGYFISLTVFGILSFLFILFSLILFYIDNKNKLQEQRNSSFIEGYADMMVHSYFYDYLKKIIPDQGTGLFDKIMRYKEIENLEDEDFPFNKIFIIIFESGKILTNIDDIDKICIEPRKTLILNCDGSVSTRFKGSESNNGQHNEINIYKVKSEILNKHVTIAVGPSFLTLHKASEKDPELNNMKKQIVKLFSEKLSKKLAENVEYANSFEVMLYNDDPKWPCTLADEIIHKHIDQGYVIRREALECQHDSDSVTIQLY